MTTELLRFDVAYQAIMVAKNIDEVKMIRDKAEALRLYLKQQGEGLEMQNACAEIKVRAERRAGELLKVMQADGQVNGRGGNRKSNSHGASLKLSDIGVNHSQSSRFQAIADIPEEVFETKIAQTKAKKEELTTKQILNVAKQEKKKRQRTEQSPPKGQSPTVKEIDGCRVIFGDAKQMDLSQFEKYSVIIADPPWPYRVQNMNGTANNHYNVMTDSDLRAMPVSQLSLPDSVLFLWGTWPKLPEAVQLIQAWGFEYVTGFPWVKTTSDGNPDYGVGYWIRGASEYILIARKGNVSAEPLKQKGYLGLMGPNLKHSRKPDSVHQMAEEFEGPYLELFARRPHHGWTVFGNDETLFQKTLA